MTVCFTNGCFDLFHYGHLELLRQARMMGNYLIVGINSDSSIKRLKGYRRPIIPEDERYTIIAELKCVDEAIMFDEDTPYELIKKVNPDIIVKGGDYKPEDVVGHDLAEVRIIPLVEGKSTSNIITKIRMLYG